MNISIDIHQDEIHMRAERSGPKDTWCAFARDAIMEQAFKRAVSARVDFAVTWT